MTNSSKLEPIKKELYDIISLAEHVDEVHGTNIDLDELWFWFVDTYEPNNGSIVSMSTAVLEKDQPWLVDFKNAIKAEFGDRIDLLVAW